MAHRGLLLTSLGLIATGMIGLAVTAGGYLLLDAAARSGSSPTWRSLPPGDERGEFSSIGERIYFTGVGGSGRIESTWQPSPHMGGRWRMRSAPPCAYCHGSDGRGGRVGMMGGGVRAPDIRYRTLAEPHGENGEQEPGMSEADIAKAIREGIEPSGEKLDPIMPRWEMSDSDMAQLIRYLKEL